MSQWSWKIARFAPTWRSWRHLANDRKFQCSCNILSVELWWSKLVCHMFCGCVLLFTAAVHRALWYDKGEQLFRRRRRTDASLTYVLCRPSNLVSAVSINTESCLDLRPEMQPWKDRSVYSSSTHRAQVLRRRAVAAAAEATQMWWIVGCWFWPYRYVNE